MSPDRFIPRKVAEYGHPDLQDAKKLLEKISTVDGADRIAVALEALEQAPSQGNDPSLEEVARQVLKNQILAYSYWWMNCVVGGKVLRGKISLWQRTPDPEKLSFVATLVRR